MSGRVVTGLDKSFPAALFGRPIGALDHPLSAFSTPLFVVDGPALEHNIAAFAAWTSKRGLELMPHGKTTMSPVLWRRQLDAGATGITLATGWQAAVALQAGVPTVQIANMCADPGLLRRLASWLVDHPEQELVVWADSVAVVDAMAAALPPTSRIGVLVELGADGGRTGARTEAELLAIAERVAQTPSLTLRGVGGYEGALGHDRSPEALRLVRAYTDRLAASVELVRPLVHGVPWVSGGGSAYFDIVAESFASVRDARRMLRSGAYLVHDEGFYRGISPLDPSRDTGADEPLRPAMHGYARVVSQPEPGLALLDAGKRDLPFDEGLPVVLGIADELGGAERPIEARIAAMNDQHSFLRWDSDAPVRIGDVVRLGLSHPCTAFDKWRLVPVSDGAGNIREAVETFF